MFSREKQKTRDLGVLIRQAKTLAKNQDQEYKLKYNDECIDATKNIYTTLTARITKAYNDNYNRAMQYRANHWK